MLRGGVDTRDKIGRHAVLLESRFTYQDEPARGISLFAARGDLDARVVLGAKLSTYSNYYRIKATSLASLARCLPIFRSSRWTLLRRPPPGGEARPEAGILDGLLDILGPTLDDPRYSPKNGTVVHVDVLPGSIGAYFDVVERNLAATR